MASAQHELPMPPLYERDFYSWALEQARLLRGRRFAELDVENLIDEVESLARGEARELKSRYITLLLHLLKWQVQRERRSRSWAITIGRERREIMEHLAENPGLQPRRAELFAKAYQTARDNVAIETGLPLDVSPAENPYALDQAMDPEFWPGGPEMAATVPAKHGRRRP